MNRSFHQSGVGLIEVLIASLVLSIGLLGMANLEIKSTAANNSSMARTQATIASFSIMDAMRADRQAAIAGAYNDKPVTTGACVKNGGQFADVNLYLWCSGSGGKIPDGLAALGPGAKGEVSCTATGNCTVKITFDDSKASGGKADKALTFTTEGIL